MKWRWIRLILVLAAGGVTLEVSCGRMMIESIKTGTLSWISGSVSQSLGTTQVSDFVTNLFTGGFTGTDRDNRSNL